jgi:serine/threonine protein phosphatase PrpC
MTQSLRFDSHVITDTGLVREQNEDDSLVLDDHGLFVVADGMGGHNCGEVASMIAVKSLREFFSNPDITNGIRDLYEELKQTEETEGMSGFHEFRLRSAIEYGNLQIFRKAHEDPDLEDMGTTLVSIAFVGSRVYVGHVGDSRAYRYRGDELVQLTEDHSLANEYIKLNLLRREDLPYFPYKNVIVRALGLQEQVEVDTHFRTCRPGDRFLLCSDGLTDLVSDDHIASILTQEMDPKKVCDRLLTLALDRGGVDNITALIVNVDGDS